MTAGEHNRVRIFDCTAADGRYLQLNVGTILTQSKAEVIYLQVDDGPEVLLVDLATPSRLIVRLELALPGPVDCVTVDGRDAQINVDKIDGAAAVHVNGGPRALLSEQDTQDLIAAVRELMRAKYKRDRRQP